MLSVCQNKKEIDEAKDTATVKISALGSLKNELECVSNKYCRAGWPIGLALSSSTSNVKLSRTDSSLASGIFAYDQCIKHCHRAGLNFDNGGGGFSSTTGDIGIGSLTIDLGTWAAGPAFTGNGIFHLVLDHWRYH